MSSMTFRALEAAEYASWFSANSASLPQRSPFHHPAWLDAVSQGTGFEVRFIGVVDGSEIVGAVPGFLTQRGPLRLFGSPLRGTMTSYLGSAVARPELLRRRGQRGDDRLRRFRTAPMVDAVRTVHDPRRRPRKGTAARRMARTAPRELPARPRPR